MAAVHEDPGTLQPEEDRAEGKVAAPLKPQQNDRPEFVRKEDGPGQEA
jgi:hypothetical protein